MAQVDSGDPDHALRGIGAVEDPPGGTDLVLPLREHSIADPFRVKRVPQAVRPPGVVRTVERVPTEPVADGDHHVGRAAHGPVPLALCPGGCRPQDPRPVRIGHVSELDVAKRGALLGEKRLPRVRIGPRFGRGEPIAYELGELLQATAGRDDEEPVGHLREEPSLGVLR